MFNLKQYQSKPTNNERKNPDEEGNNNITKATGPKLQVAESMFTVIDKHSKFRGDIDSDGDLIIDGEFEGSIKANTLTIAKNGNVRGVVKVNELRVFGAAEPEIECKGTLIVGETGQIKGNIKFGLMQVALGGKCTGILEEISSIKK